MKHEINPEDIELVEGFVQHTPEEAEQSAANFCNSKEVKEVWKKLLTDKQYYEQFMAKCSENIKALMSNKYANTHTFKRNH
jgi:hypothetical protein